MMMASWVMVQHAGAGCRISNPGGLSGDTGVRVRRVHQLQRGGPGVGGRVSYSRAEGGGAEGGERPGIAAGRELDRRTAAHAEKQQILSAGAVAGMDQ